MTTAAPAPSQHQAAAAAGAAAVVAAHEAALNSLTQFFNYFRYCADLVVPDCLYCDGARPRQAAGPPSVCPDPHQELPLRVGGEGARHYQVLPLLHTQAQGHLLNYDTQHTLGSPGKIMKSQLKMNFLSGIYLVAKKY